MPTPPPAVVAVDVGGSAIKAAVTLRDGTELCTVKRPTPVADGPAAVVEAIVGCIDELRDRTSGRAHVVAVGVIPLGLVDPVAGIAVFSANAGWRDLPLRQLVADRVGLPVAIDHDVRAAGLAELRSGAARGVDEAVFVSIGTGIAAAVISGGRVLPGAAGLAGELGHVPVVADGEPCACGQRGCVETYSSAASIARRFRAAITTDPAGRLGAGMAEDRPVTAAEVISRAGRGDQVATRVFDEAVAALARGLVGYLMIMDPSVIIIGGGLANAGSALLDPLSRAVRAGLAWRSAPPLVVGHYGDSAGRIGAALIGWRAVDQPSTAAGERS
jgi:glucokinase